MELDAQELRWLRAISKVLKDVAYDARVVDEDPQAALLASLSIPLIKKVTCEVMSRQCVHGHLRLLADYFYDSEWSIEFSALNKHLAEAVSVAAAIMEGLPSSDEEVEKLISGLGEILTKLFVDFDS